MLSQNLILANVCDSFSMTYAGLTHSESVNTAEGKVSFLGVSFDALDMDGAVAALLNHVRTNRPLSYIVTPNVDHMVRLHAEPGLRPLYDGAGLTVCDSRILELLARFDGKMLNATPGADLVEILLRQHVRPDDRIVVIGAGADVIAALEQDFGFSDIHWHEPPMGLRKNPEAIERAARFVTENTKGFAFLCVGSPQQEMIAKRALDLGGGHGMMLCCGASLDFLSGKTSRAPLWVRENRLEWLHRLISQPGRLWKRYLIEGPKILRIWMAYRARPD